MHARVAVIAGELPVERIVLLLLGHIFEQLGDDVAELMRLALAHDVAGDAARILDVLVRLRICQMVSGSSPVGCHRCTAKISELRRGWSSKMRSVGVLERMPPSQ